MDGLNAELLNVQNAAKAVIERTALLIKADSMISADLLLPLLKAQAQ